MSASRDSHDADRPLWLSLLGDWIALVCVGIVVKLLVGWLLPHEAPRGVELSAWDALMRDKAKADLRGTPSADPWNCFVFIDVDEKTCQAWALSGCTMSSVTSRKGLAGVISKIVKAASTSEDKPALVVLDIDLARVADADADDTALCTSVIQLADLVPVIVVRPTVIILGDNPGDDRVEGHASIFDAGFDTGPNRRFACPPALPTSANAPPGAKALWFGSDLVWDDGGPVVRRVKTGQKVSIVDQRAGELGDTMVGSIGLLGGALLSKADPAELACLFPGSTRSSRPDTPPCEKDSALNRRINKVLNRSAGERDPPYLPVRIRFSVPSWKQDRNGRTYANVSKLLCHLPAHRLGKRPGDLPGSADTATCGRVNALKDSVVMIGGSFLASGDRHATPLNVGVPGALIHINAIRAFAQALQGDDAERWVFNVRESWLDWGLIPLAAFLGAALHALTRWLSHGKSAPGKAAIDLAMSLGGTIVEVVVIFAITMSYGAAQLFAGNGVEILTPPLVIAFEGLSIGYSSLRELFKVVVDATLEWAPRLLPLAQRGRDGRAAETSAPRSSHLALKIEVDDDQTH